MSPIFTLLLSGAIALAVSPPSPRSAEIRVTRGETVRLDATVTTESPASGSYELHVVKVGRSGRSESRQSGAFDAAGPGLHVLSTHSVALATGDHIEARLTVTWADGQIARDTFEETVQ